jgi:hypothetical protein
LLFSILAIVTGSNSYRGIFTFIDVHRRKLNTAFGLKQRPAPLYKVIRDILKGLDPAEIEVNGGMMPGTSPSGTFETRRPGLTMSSVHGGRPEVAEPCSNQRD